MTVTLKKITDGKYQVNVNRKIEGVATVDYKGMYVFKLPSGSVINAVSQDALKRMIKKYW